MLAPGERSAGFSNMMVVRAGELRAAMAIFTVRKRSALDSLSSQICFRSIESSGGRLGGRSPK